MDIFNQPPTISEDTLVYTIYPTDDLDKSAVSSLSTLISSYVYETLLPSTHIWHRDSFNVKIVERSVAKTTKLAIEGTMRVGDAVDDEWCAVWLLTEVSKKWDVVISAYDSDGEFLMIEAAEHLPSWVTPENAENRVWIYRSNLHIIPLEHVSPPSAANRRTRRKLPGHPDEDTEFDETDDFLILDDAVKLVRNDTVATQASDAVQAAIRRKIAGYPAALHQHIHRARVFLPSDIVLVLSQNPSLVQKAAEAFYTRDALQLRVVSKMNRFPPSTSVYTTISMTRTAYAQLSGQKFHPPKVFGRWSEPEGSKEWKWKDIGMKVACGFAMLQAENKSRSVTASFLSQSNAAVKDALQRYPDYQGYIANLKKAGYFPDGELEGSAKWNERETKAAMMWMELRKNDDANRQTFTSMVDEAFARALEEKDAILAQATSRTDEDPDDWLDVNPDGLEAVLAGHSRQPKQEASMDVDPPQGQVEEVEEDGQAKKEAKRLEDLAKKVEKFVDGRGDLDGARFEDDLLSDDDEGEGEELELSDPPTSESECEDEIEAQAKRQQAMDDLVPPLEDGEYGKLPAAPETSPKSQKTTKVTLETEARTLPNGEVRKIRKPILMRDKFDGVDSDDETTEEEDEGEDTRRALDTTREDDESDDEAPQVVGGVTHDADINMEEEEEEFLRFSREALGISESQWNEIVQERKGRGAYVPQKSTATAEPEGPSLSTSTESKLKNKKNKFLGAISDPTPVAQPAPSKAAAEVPPPGPHTRNPDLDSFETVMDAMEAELNKAREARKATGPTPAKDPVSAPAKDKGKGKARAPPVDDIAEEEEDDETAMDAELRAALRRDDEDEDDPDAEEAGIDYNLMKNFLESFRSQGGLSGPVSNLASRLQPGYALPRDES